MTPIETLEAVTEGLKAATADELLDLYEEFFDVYASTTSSRA